MILSTLLANLGDTLLTTAVSNSLVAGGIAGLAVCATRLRLNPSIAHCLWVLVLVKLVTPPLFEVRVPLPALSAAERIETPRAESSDEVLDIAPLGPVDLTGVFRGRTDGPRSTSTDRRSGSTRLEAETLAPGNHGTGEAAADSAEPTSWSTLALWLWGLGAVTALGVGLYRAARFHRGLRYARPAPDDVRREARELSRRLGIRRTPAIRVLPGKLSPMLWGFLGPAQVLLPEVLEKNLSPDQKRTLLAHELAHLHRRDHWVRVLEMVVRAIHWWNPLVFWSCRQLRNAEEECCDAWVVWALPEASRSYADALLDTVEFLSDAPDVPVHASGIGKVNNLKRRLIMIMKGDNRRTLGHLGRAAVLGLATLTLPLVPAFGQVEEPDFRGQTETMKAQDKPLQKKAVVAALQRAVKLLAQNDRGQDARVLRSLLQKVRGSRSTDVAARRIDMARDDLDTRRADTRARAESLRTRAERAYDRGDTQKAAMLRAQMQKLREEADKFQSDSRQLSDRARAIAVDRNKALTTAREYESARQRYRDLAARDLELAKKNADRTRAITEQEAALESRDRYNRSRAVQGDARVRDLEQKVQRLTDAVEKLLDANRQESRRRNRDRGRGRGREEEIEEEVELEEEEEMEEEIEEEVEVEEVEEIEEEKEVEIETKEVEKKRKATEEVEVEEIRNGKRGKNRSSRRGRDTRSEKPTKRGRGRNLIGYGR